MCMCMNPSECLKVYIDRTQHQRPPDARLLIVIGYPLSGCQADIIGKILNDAIIAAGLGDLGYSAKSFRLTGAMVAVSSGELNCEAD